MQSRGQEASVELLALKMSNMDMGDVNRNLNMLAALASEEWERIHPPEKEASSSVSIAKGPHSEEDDGDSREPREYVRREPRAPRLVRVYRAQGEQQVLTRAAARQRSANPRAAVEVPDLNLPPDEVLNEEIVRELVNGRGQACEMARFCGEMVHHLESKFQIQKFYRKKLKSMSRKLFREFYKGTN